MNRGSSCRQHVHREAQQHQATTLGGTPTTSLLGAALHELFGTVVLARVSATAWQRPAPLAGPAPKPSPRSGRGHVIRHGEVHGTQVIRMTDADVVNWLADPGDPAN
ncbi:hypothetical protein ACIP93_37185 [Streptomyces sp. NPDC088745]|uniref:hypothetical protein n=1 Tax=Streptomyces sp. NPDC088745 TaxID=3365884 RepID=UPI00382BE546